jgi:PAS domain S-box-containing protein
MKKNDFKTFIENANDCFVVISGEIPLIVFANSRTSKCLGINKKELIGKPMTKYIHESEREKIVNNYKKRISGKYVPSIYSSLFIRKNGEEFSVELTASRGEWNGEPATFVVFRDISEQKRLENRLKRSESLLKEAQEIAHIANYERNLITGEGKWSDELYKILGYESGKIESLDSVFNEHILPEERDLLKEKLQQARESKESIKHTFRIKDRAGSIKHILAIMHQEKDRFFGIIQDITEMQRLQEKASEKNQLLKIILDNIPHFVFWKDKESRFLGGNRNFAKILGLNNPDDLIGKTDYDFSFTKEEADFYRECDRKVIESEKPMLNIEETQRRADGKHTVILTSKVPLREINGKIIGLLGIYADITEIKYSEKQLSLLLEKLNRIINSTNDIIITVDNNGIIDSWNEAAKKKIGLSKKKATGLPIDTLPSSAEAIKSFIKNILVSKKTHMLELDIYDSNENKIILLADASLIYDNFGKPDGVVFFGRDITTQSQISVSLSKKQGYISTNESVEEILETINLYSTYEKLVISRNLSNKFINNITSSNNHITYVNLSSRPKDKKSSADLNYLFRFIKLHVEKNPQSIILITHLHYLSFHNSFTDLMKFIYKVNDLIRVSKCICIYHVVSDCFDKKELTYIKDECILYPSESSSVSLDKKLFDILTFIIENNDLQIIVHFSHISKKFRLSRKTTKKYLDNLQQNGLIKIKKVGREKQIISTSLGKAMLKD